MNRLRALLRNLLLIAALLDYAAVATAHDHDAPRISGDGLCAICIHGGASLGGVVALPSPLVQAPRHASPAGPVYHSIAAVAAAQTRIRGPPSSC